MKNLEKLQEIMNYMDHICAHVSRVIDKDWLYEELENLEKEIYKLVNGQQEEIQLLETDRDYWKTKYLLHQR